MKLLRQILVGLLLLSVAELWAQVDDLPKPPAASSNIPVSTGDENPNSDPMPTPPPVSGQSYPVVPTSQERSNFLRGGVTFMGAYSDNVLGSTGPNSAPVSDVSYSIFPTVTLDETTTRLRWTLNYAPGFTFYQRTSSRNEQDQNASISFQYRVSPHVTFSANDSFQKSSSVFNQPDLAAAGTVSGGAQGPDLGLLAPISDQLHNSGTVGITYQFAANEMMGASGSFTNLHYPNQTEVPGLFDSESQSGSGFYAYRVSNAHYLGVSYQYQRLLSFPTQGQNETQTHAIFGFYTFSPAKRFSISMFGGPQYAEIGPQFLIVGSVPQPGSRSWIPAGGTSLNWQGAFTGVAVSYSYLVTPGSGLISATRSDAATASIRQQMGRALTASLSGGYSENQVVDGLDQTAGGSSNGHTVSGTASLQRLFGEHMNVQLGYTRLHQSYNVAAISTTPDINREFVSVSYQFARPLGR
jgi:hypothetical protein